MKRLCLRRAAGFRAQAAGVARSPAPGGRGGRTLSSGRAQHAVREAKGRCFRSPRAGSGRSGLRREEGALQAGRGDGEEERGDFRKMQSAAWNRARDETCRVWCGLLGRCPPRAPVQPPGSRWGRDPHPAGIPAGPRLGRRLCGRRVCASVDHCSGRGLRGRARCGAGPAAAATARHVCSPSPAARPSRGPRTGLRARTRAGPWHI